MSTPKTLTLTNDNKVGISNSSPSEKLDVQGNIQISDSSGNKKIGITNNGEIQIGTSSVTGTSGQVLTSGGSGGSVSWTTLATSNSICNFSAVASSSQTISNDTLTTIGLSSQIDSHTGFNNSTNKYKIQEAGDYTITASIGITSETSAQTVRRWIVYIVKDSGGSSTNLIQGRLETPNDLEPPDPDSVTISTMKTLAVNDEIYLQIYGGDNDNNNTIDVDFTNLHLFKHIPNIDGVLNLNESGTSGQVLTSGGPGGSVSWTTPSASSSNFTDLLDTPSTLGTSGQILTVNSGGNALEFNSQITFDSSQIYPNNNNSVELGAESKIWNKGYFNEIRVNTIHCNYIKPYTNYSWNFNTDSHIQMGASNGDDRIFIIQDGTSSAGTSDDRVKHNEENINNGLSIIRQLLPQKYQKTEKLYDEDYNGEIYDKWQWEVGLIAQDILKISDLSHCVSGGDKTDESGNVLQIAYTLKYNDIFVYNLAATQELDTIVQSQQNTINELNNKVQNLENENITIKAALNELLSDAGKATI